MVLTDVSALVRLCCVIEERSFACRGRFSEHREETKHSNVLAFHTTSVGQAGGMLLFHSPDPLDPVTTVSTIFVFCFRLW